MHIESRKLYDAVTNQAYLTESELEHLKTCDECLEVMRVFVRQRLDAAKGAEKESAGK